MSQTGDSQPPQREVYTHGYSPRVQAIMAARSAANEAGFLLPHLSPGMSVLDCGCGPGSITVDLALVVAPGQVVGIDIEPSQVAAARAGALERGVANVQFELATIYELPFPTASFDSVFAHTAIQHLSDPLRALREMRRVLRPGGVIGLRDDDAGTWILEPTSPSLELWFTLFVKVWTHNGGDPYLGRKHRRLLGQAGFVRAQASSSTALWGSPEATSGAAAGLVAHHRDPAFVSVVLAKGWADQSQLEAMYAEIGTWGERADAFVSVTFCEALGWKPEDEP